MESCVRNILTKNYQNLIIGFKFTIKNVGDVFLRHSVFYLLRSAHCTYSADCGIAYLCELYGESCALLSVGLIAGIVLYDVTYCGCRPLYTIQPPYNHSSSLQTILFLCLSKIMWHFLYLIAVFNASFKAS